MIKADSYKFLLRKSDNMIVVLGSDNSILSMYKNTEECYFNSLTEDQIDYILNKLMSKMHNTIKRVRDSAISEDIETYLDSDKKIHYQIRIHYDGQVVMVIRRNTQIENEIEEFFELSPHILIILNREAEVINANRSFVELFGLDIDKIKGSRITDFFNGEELSEIMQISDMFLETNEVTNYEVSVSTSRGIRDLKVSGIMKNDNIYISADDITDMKKLTYSLEHSRMNYQNMFNSIDEFIFILNSNGEIIYSNRAVNEKTGYSVSDLRNIRFSGIVLDKNVNELEEDLVEILNGERVDSHLTFQTKDKKGIPTHAKAWLSKWNDGDVIFVFAKDLSTEQELLIRFNKLFYSNPNYLTLHDYQDEKILEVNETFLKTFGFTKEEVIGKTFKDIGLQSLVKSSSLKSYLTSIKTTHEETYFDGIKNINLLHYIELIESKTANYLLSELIDVTELTKAKEQVQYYSSFQDILMKLATEFINVPLDKVTNTINKALEMMGKFIDTDRVYIFDYNFEKGTTSNLYEWCNDNIEPQIEVLQDVPLESIASWVNRHLLGETIHITNVSNLSNDDKVRVILESQNIKSVLTVPMMLSDTCVGFAGFDSVRTEKIYTDEELDLLHLFTQMIVNILNREQQEKLLIAKINEREILVNEIHHRVKNNLQIVSSLLYLQTLHTDSKKVKKILQGSINRLKAMALLHDRIYKGDDLGDFNFKEYVIGINKQLFDYYTIGKDIKLIMDIDNIRININKAVPVGLMINELVTNAVQHAFIDRQTGMLSIRVKEEEECLILEIADNGIGINISLDELKIKSLGMQIVDSLVNQLSGTMILEVNNGTKFTIKLPKANLS